MKLITTRLDCSWSENTIGKTLVKYISAKPKYVKP